MIDWTLAIGGVLCAWVFLLLLSHERQRRMQELEAEWAMEQHQRAIEQASAAISANVDRRKAA